LTQRLPLVLAVAALIGGCGADGQGSNPTAGATASSNRPYGILYVNPDLTKRKFVAHVNGLCRRKWRFIQNAVRQTSVITAKAHPQTSRLQRYSAGVQESYAASIGFHIYTEIQHLGAPPGEKQAVEDVLRAMQDGMKRGQETPVTGPAQVEAMFTDYNRLARRYGLDECLAAGSHLPYPEVVKGHA
jgi:hypothetical protein